MPKVGTKSFPYTKLGMKMAKEYSRKVGLPLTMDEAKEVKMGMEGIYKRPKAKTAKKKAR